MNTSIYQQLGIDPHKTSIRDIFAKVIKNDIPGMFVNVVRDPFNPGWLKTKHSDGDGSKILQRILHYLETGDEAVFQGAVDDALSMNIGDVAAAGAVYVYELTQVCNVGEISIELKETILRQIALRLVSIINFYKQHGISVTCFGGETADLPDQIRSFVFDMDVRSKFREVDAIKGNAKPGDKIWGLASDGQAAWEAAINSGVGSNGLTMLRIFLMHTSYAVKYPWLCRDNSQKHFCGKYLVTDSHRLLESLELTVSEAIMSPTRQWAIPIKMLVDKLKSRSAMHLLHGITMNTGGGATKVVHIGQGINYVKKIPPLPPFFQLIQEEANESDQNMLTTFNCGIGLDIVGDSRCGTLEQALLEVSEESKIKLFSLGHCLHNIGGNNQIDVSIARDKYAMV